jgi:hypothetical protein
MKEEGRRSKEVYIWGYRTPTQNERPCVLVGVLNLNSEDNLTAILN